MCADQSLVFLGASDFEDFSVELDVESDVDALPSLVLVDGFLSSVELAESDGLPLPERLSFL
ncbi:MAG: hypothetical protein VX410_00145 [Actinomycetota bacterium]|nr:hypothetical protein [Actinomycetota bacterium]